MKGLPRTSRLPGKSYLGTEPQGWTWRELRDYVVSSLIDLHGSTVRPGAPVEASIFKSFMSRYGEKAPLIAMYAIEVMSGKFGDRQIDVYAFSRKSGEYFGDKIAKLIEEQ